jgi:hypothetical protein
LKTRTKEKSNPTAAFWIRQFALKMRLVSRALLIFSSRSEEMKVLFILFHQLYYIWLAQMANGRERAKCRDGPEVEIAAKWRSLEEP